jgi:hypothetical protein
VQEAIPASEAAETQRLIDRLRDMMSRRDRNKVQRRDVHMKMHGVMRAEFIVPRRLDLDLRVGLFAQPATYEAWVRFSNADNNSQPDAKGDIRGMAIKVMGVPGAKVLPTESDAGTHDFVLISAANFPSRTPGEFDELVAAILGSLPGKALYFLTHVRVLWMLLTTRVKHANVLQIRYFSAVPYSFGGHAVKYVATPRVASPDTMPTDPSRDFLREVAVAQLSGTAAVFDFGIQFQRDEASMPLEDPRRAWSLTLSPPRNVATLRIPPQEFDTEVLRAFGENLSFTPWHCLPEHRPLGAINRARRVIYETLSRFRHEANRAPQREPDGWDV